MRIKAIALLIMVSLALPIATHASANLAATPASVRQTYPDASFTEISCSLPKTCTFTLGKRNGATSQHTFPAAAPGHDGPIMVIDPYYFWPAYQSRPWVLKFEIQCSESDIAMVDGATLENTNCFAYLELNHGKMVYDRIEVVSQVSAVPTYKSYRPGKHA